MSIKNENDQHGEFSSRISDEINCSICLDILVNPLTLVPCGHSFCTNCCLSSPTKSGKRRKTLCFTKCPQCRQPIKETVRPRQLESLIDTLVTVPNLLFRNDDDKKHFLERRAVEKDRSQIHPAPTKCKKRRRQDSHPTSYNLPVPPAATATIATNPHAQAWNHRAGVPARFARTNASFDPMVAPLPPPYDDFAPPAMGYTFPPFPPHRQPSTGRSGTTANTSGVSASDPICID